MPTFYQKDLAMRNTSDVTGRKPIAASSQSISDMGAVGPLVAFYDIHGRKEKVLLFWCVLNITRDIRARQNGG
jgi:hypothetical protein